MTYEEFPPPQKFQRLVASYWRFALSDNDPETIEHTIVPDGAVSISCKSGLGPPAIAIVGPRVHALRLAVLRNSTYWGVRFQPGATSGAIGLPGEWLRDKVMPLHEIRPALHALLMAVIQEQADAPSVFESIINPDAIIDPEVERAVRSIIDSHGSIRIGEVAEQSRLSDRQLLRRFRLETGLTLKELAKIRRIRWACVQALQNQPWAEVSDATGFSDQSHLSREFDHAFGWTPRLVAEYLRRIEHRNVSA